MNIENIVTVDVKLQPYTPKYQVLIDMPLDKVLEVARNNEPEGIFTLPFYTRSVDEVPDFSTVSVIEYDREGMSNEEIKTHNDNCLVVKEGLDHLMKPWYVGNFDKPYDAIKEIINMYFKDGVEVQ